MRTSIVMLVSLMAVGCGGSEEGGTVTEEDTGSATTETSTTDDTGTTVTDTGTSTDDTGSTTEETGADTMTSGDTMMAGDTKVDAPADTPIAAATFTQVYAIIAAKCGGCHTTSTSGNLDMKDKATAYKSLVGVKAKGAACAPGGMTRVVAGNADMSLLIHKLTRPDAMVCGEPMPLMRPALPATEIATIRAWITAGAKND